MNPFYEDLKDEGRAEGRVEGRAEGQAEGRAEGHIEGRAEGHIEGRTAEREEIVGNLIRLGVDDQVIVDSTGVAIESIVEMRDRLNGS